MHPKTRFRLWAGLVVLLLAGQPAWLGLAETRFGLWGGALLFMLALAGFAGLLLTTPPNAIRLTREHSWGTIVGGMVWLQGWGLLLLAPSGVMSQAAWIGGVAIVTILLLALLWRLGTSPWWATLIAWNPLALPGMVLLLSQPA